MKNKLKIVYKKNGGSDFITSPIDALVEEKNYQDEEINTSSNNIIIEKSENKISSLVNQINSRSVGKNYGKFVTKEDDDDIKNIKLNIEKIKKDEIDITLLKDLDRIKIVVPSLIGIPSKIKEKREKWNNDVNNLIKFVFNKFIITNFYENTKYKNQFIKDVHLNFNNKNILFFIEYDLLNLFLYPYEDNENLIDKKLDKLINIKHKNETIFKYLFEEKNIKILNYIYNKNINIQDDDGNTPLMYTILLNDMKNFKYLIEKLKKNDINTKNFKNETALSLVINNNVNNKEEFIRNLFKYGANYQNNLLKEYEYLYYEYNFEKIIKSSNRNEQKLLDLNNLNTNLNNITNQSSNNESLNDLKQKINEEINKLKRQNIIFSNAQMQNQIINRQEKNNDIEIINKITIENLYDNKEYINKIINLKNENLKIKIYEKLFSLVSESLKNLDLDTAKIEFIENKNIINIIHKNVKNINTIVKNKLKEFENYYNIIYK